MRKKIHPFSVPYEVVVPYERRHNWYPGYWQELSEWCNQYVGKDHWNFYNECFVFVDHKDALMFRLRWS